MNCPLKLSHRYLNFPSSFYTLVKPQPLAHSRWVAWNGELARNFGLSKKAPQNEVQTFLFGEVTDEEHPSLAMKYAGHQFGSYNPELGDGRGLLLGELTDTAGIKHDLHLKGAGLTPYSRMGDGRAVLRSTIREYLGSEAMAGLGIPTTRALGMFTSDTVVYREKGEYGAMLLRTSESHIRFGHFEHFFYQQQHDHLKLLADQCIDWYWPELKTEAQPYVAMFRRVVEATVEMIASWQAVGFTHGVMNTDNMSILGQTFDYGPYGFMDGFEQNFIPNHSDYNGRYSFKMQPSIAYWNLTALGYALSPLIDSALIEQELQRYQPLLSKAYSGKMRHKLGLRTTQDDDSQLFDDLFHLLDANKTDYTRFMRELSNLDSNDPSEIVDLVIDRDGAEKWLDRYLARCHQEVDASGNPISSQERCEAMRSVNPKYVLRNYLAQIAIEKAELGDYSEIESLMTVLNNPFEEHPSLEHYAALPPHWASDIEISCSS